MPPKPKICKEEILDVSFNLIRTEGMNALNARNIASILKCSTRPIFTWYESMIELRNDVLNKVDQYHTEYINQHSDNDDYLFSVSMAYINFALDEPKLFEFLFVSGAFQNISLFDIISSCSSDETQQNEVVMSESMLSTGRDIWVYAHGIASLLVFNQFKIDKEEIQSMVKNMISSLTQENSKGLK